MASIFLALPYTKPDTRDFTISLAKFMSGSSREIDKIIWKNAYGLDHAGSRNYLIESWKLDKTDYLLFVDNDCVFPAGAVERLVERNKPIICGGMFTKTIPPRPTIGIYMGADKDGKDHYSFEEYGNSIIHYAHAHNKFSIPENAYLFPKGNNSDDLMKCDACGMHFTLIRKDVLETIKPPYFVMMGKSGAGEDFYFCKKAREAGFDIYTDKSVQTGHCAGETYDFGLRELLILNEMVTKGVIFESNMLRSG